jgi:hypothetical protein
MEVIDKVKWNGADPGHMPRAETTAWCRHHPQEA